MPNEKSITIPMCKVCGAVCSIGIRFSQSGVPRRVWICTSGHAVDAGFDDEDTRVWEFFARRARDASGQHIPTLDRTYFDVAVYSAVNHKWTISRNDIVSALDQLPDPCPFCQKVSLVLVIDDGEFSVCCEACGAVGASSADAPTAIRRWNRC